MSRYIDISDERIYYCGECGEYATFNIPHVVLNEVIEIPTWIPCSEKLPKVGEAVLITIKHRKGDYIALSSLFSNGLWSGFTAKVKVIAWQPLPMPYREENDNADKI